MSDRLDFYFKQNVKESDLDLAFDQLESADQKFASDLGVFGIVSGGAVVAHTPIPDRSVDIVGPTVVYDRKGRRIYIPSTVSVDTSVDFENVPVAPSAVGRSRVLSIYALFDRKLEEPKIDGNSQTVLYRRLESYKLVQVQGPEVITAPGWEFNDFQNEHFAGKPDPDSILLADVWVTYDHTQSLPIGAGDIFYNRREEAIQIGSRPTADQVDLLASDPWRDGTENPAQDLQVRMDNLIGGLASDLGAGRIGSRQILGSPTSLASGSIDSQLEALLIALNARVLKSGDIMTGALEPSVSGLRLGIDARRWSIYATEISANGDITTAGRIIPKVQGLLIGDPAGVFKFSSIFNASSIDVATVGSMKAMSFASSIGAAADANKFDAHLDVVTAYGALTAKGTAQVDGQLRAYGGISVDGSISPKSGFGSYEDVNIGSLSTPFNQIYGKYLSVDGAGAFALPLTVSAPRQNPLSDKEVNPWGQARAWGTVVGSGAVTPTLTNDRYGVAAVRTTAFPGIIEIELNRSVNVAHVHITPVYTSGGGQVSHLDGPVWWVVQKANQAGYPTGNKFWVQFFQYDIAAGTVNAAASQDFTFVVFGIEF